MSRRKSDALTAADLVLLSLLAERPYHGYEANLELERRQVRDWAGVSRPQVYYSLDKLARLGFIRPADDRQPSAGPARARYAVAAAGRATLAEVLERPDWCSAPARPPFLTWMALSWQAGQGVFAQQLRRRRDFLEDELRRERATLRAVLAEVGHPYHEAAWMLKLVIAQMRAELLWLRQVAAESSRRAPAGARPTASPTGDATR